MQTALARWHELHDARARQMDAAYARLGRTSTDLWQRRASGFHRDTRNTAQSDPFFQQVLHLHACHPSGRAQRPYLAIFSS